MNGDLALIGLLILFLLAMAFMYPIIFTENKEDENHERSE